MKILFFSYAYPNAINPGLGTFNRTMVAGLASEHDVRVVSPVPFVDVWKARVQGRLPRGLNDRQFQAVPNVQTDYCSWYYTPKLFRNQYGKFMQRSVGATLKRTMHEFQPDIVLSYWTHPDSEVAVKTAHEFGVRAVTIVGGSDVLINARNGARRKTILDVLHAADEVVTVSENIRQTLIADGVPVKKLTVARRGIDRQMFHAGDRTDARTRLGLPDDRPILISVGRLVDVKGHQYLIEACQRLALRRIAFRCYLLGDGQLRAKFERQIIERGLSDSVELRGSQTPAQLADWYRAADHSVLASLSEGVPNVLLESIASGTPFIASNVGGIPEIADLMKDTLVPAADSEALANAIADALAKPMSRTNSPRRFEPSNNDVAAAHLASILRMVQTGRSTLLADATIMHETMTAADLTPVPHVEIEQAIENPVPANEAGKSDNEFLDQSHDYSHLHELISFAELTTGTELTTPIPATTNNSRVLQRTMTVMENLSSAELALAAKAGERFDVLDAIRSSALPTMANRLPYRSQSAILANQDHPGVVKSYEAMSSPTYQPEESEFDQLGRTAENFFYEP